MVIYRSHFTGMPTVYAPGETDFSASPFTHDLVSDKIVPVRYGLPERWSSKPFEFRTGWNRALFGMQTAEDKKKDALHSPPLSEQDLVQIARHNAAVAKRVVEGREATNTSDRFGEFFAIFGRMMVELERNAFINRSQPLGASYLAYLQNALQSVRSVVIPVEELPMIYKGILESREFAEMVIPVLRSFTPDYYGMGVITVMFDDLKDKLAYDAINPHFDAYRGRGIL